jgi:predicted RNase H-like nuclease (RuvC/YqgF family)
LRSKIDEEETDSMMMARRGRAMVPLLGGLAALAVVVAAVAVAFLIREQELRQKKERELAFVQAEKEDLEQQLNEVRTAKQQVEADLARAKTQLDQLNQELAASRQVKETLTKTIEDRQREIDRLNKDLSQIRTERSALAEQADTLKRQHDSMQAQLTQLEQAKAELEAKVLELTGQPTVELDKVVVTGPESEAAIGSAGGPSPVSLLQGQVLVVNREYDFIVMNIGKNQGLQIGQEFQIVRGAEVLGRVKIEKIYDELSAAAILPESNKAAIREGDLVKPI